MSSQVQITGSEMTIDFPSFGLEAYQLFLKCKRLPEYRIKINPLTDLACGISSSARFAPLLGVESPKNEGDESALFDGLLPGKCELQHQLEIIKLALDARRYAVWSNVGTGKTLIELEFGRQVIKRTGGRVLLITLNEIVGQILDEAKIFYGDGLKLERLSSREEMRQWCEGKGDGNFAITNYEKMNPDERGQDVTEFRHLDGLILDESSRLKTGGGKQKWALIKSSKGIPYKLSCTATPAPNDVMEFASQASFLERMRSENEIIWTYFSKHPVTNEWTVKPYARPAFFEWMSAWSIYLRDPRKFGWTSHIELPPEPQIVRHKIEPTDAQLAAMQEWNVDSVGQMSLIGGESQGVVGRAKLSQIGKGFVYENNKESKRTTVRRIESLKPSFVARLIHEEAAHGLNPLVWTVFDEEGDIIAEELRKLGYSHFAVLSGDTPKPKRQPILDSYRCGETPVLISKGKLLGYGMNFQHCGSMIFSGWNDSFEEFFQQIGRAVRYGQKKSVRVHLPFIEELEGAQLENVLQKASNFEQITSEQEAAYIKAMSGLRLLGAK